MDGAAFFSALFGSDRFEHLVGELMIAAAARHGGDFSPEQLRRVQSAREERLAVLLTALLRRWVEGDAAGFVDSMRAEAASLVTASFGVVMLQAIGKAYSSAAAVHLGGVLGGSVAALRAKGSAIKGQFSAASLALQVYRAQSDIARLEQLEEAQAARHTQGQQQQHTNGSLQQQGWQQGQQQQRQQQQQQQPVDPAAIAAERARLEEAALPLMLEAMWAANRLDIQATLRHVCRAVLGDQRVSKAHRRLRAEALAELGRIFLEAAAARAAEETAAEAAAAARVAECSRGATARRTMEDAMEHVVRKRMAEQDAEAGGGWTKV